MKISFGVVLVLGMTLVHGSEANVTDPIVELHPGHNCESFREKNHFVLYCSSSNSLWQTLRQDLLKIYEIISKEKCDVQLATIDCAKYKYFCKMHESRTCPTYKLHDKGDCVGSNFNGKPDFPSLVAFLQEQHCSSCASHTTEVQVSELTPKDLCDRISKQSHVVLFCDFNFPHCLKVRSILAKVQKMHGGDSGCDVQIATIDCDHNNNFHFCTRQNATTYPTFKVYKKSDCDGVKYVGSNTAQTLSAFVKAQLCPLVKHHPLVVDQRPENFCDGIDEKNYLYLYCDFTQPNCKDLKEKLETVAAVQKEKGTDLKFGSMDCKAYKFFCKVLGAKTYPLLKYHKKGDYIGVVFNGLPSEASLNDFVDRTVKNTTAKTIPIVHEQTPANFCKRSPLKHYYALFCDFDDFKCKVFRQNWERIAQKLCERKCDVQLATIDCNLYQSVCANQSIEIHKVGDCNGPSYYDEPSMDSLNAFSEQVCPAPHITEVPASHTTPQPTSQTSEKFYKGISEKSYVIMFSDSKEPSRKFEPHWGKIAEKLHEEGWSQPQFGLVKCDVDQFFCLFNDVKTYPTFKLYKKGDFIGTKYNGEPNVVLLTDFIKRNVPSTSESTAGPKPKNIIEELTPKNLHKLVAERKYLVYFCDFKQPKCKESYRQMWEQIAKAQYEKGCDVQFATLDCGAHNYYCKLLNITYPTFIFYRAGESDVVKFVGEPCEESLNRFVAEACPTSNTTTSPVEKLNTETLQQSVSKNKYLVDYCDFTQQNCYVFKGAWEQMAKWQYKKKCDVKFATIDCNSKESDCKALDVTSYPTIKFHDIGDKNGVKYNGPLTIESVNNFVERICSNTTTDLVVALGPDSLHKGISKKAQNVLYCDFTQPKCKDAKGMWEQVAKKEFERGCKSQFGTFDCVAHEYFCKPVLNIDTYPTFRIHQINDSIGVTFNGEPTVDSLINFVKKTCSKPRNITDQVLELTPSAWHKGISEGKRAVFYGDFKHDTCIKLKQLWAEIAKKQYKKGCDIQFASLDCNSQVYEYYCKPLNITKYPTFKVHKIGDFKGVTFEGAPNMFSLNNFVEQYCGNAEVGTSAMGTSNRKDTFVLYTDSMNMDSERILQIWKATEAWMRKYRNDVHFKTVYCNKDQEACDAKGITSYPTVYLYNREHPDGLLGKVHYGSVGLYEYVRKVHEFFVNAPTLWAHKCKVHDFYANRMSKTDNVVVFSRSSDANLEKIVTTWSKFADMVHSWTCMVHFETVDCDIHLDICARNKVTKFPTVYFFDVKHKSGLRYTGPFEADDLFDFYRGLHSHATAVSSPKDALHCRVLDFHNRLENTLSVVLFYKSTDSPSDRDRVWKEFINMVQEKTCDVHFETVDCFIERSICDKLEVKRHPTVYFSSPNLPEPRPYDGVFEAKPLHKFFKGVTGGWVKWYRSIEFGSAFNRRHLVMFLHQRKTEQRYKMYTSLWEQIGKMQFEQTCDIQLAIIDCNLHRAVCNRHRDKRTRGEKTFFKIYHNDRRGKQLKSPGKIENLEDFENTYFSVHKCI